jgi:hypothetical protein
MEKEESRRKRQGKRMYEKKGHVFLLFVDRVVLLVLFAAFSMLVLGFT